MMTIDDMEVSSSVKLTSEEKRAISLFMLNVARNKGDETTTVRKKTKNIRGHHQSYKVAGFPEYYLDTFDQLCFIMGAFNVSL